MTLRKKAIAELPLIGVIDPVGIYRINLSPRLFGYGAQRTRDLIKQKVLPTPMPLSESGIAQAWTGQQVLDYRAQMQALAAEKLAAELSVPKRPQPEALVGASKIKKQKLRPPSAAPPRQRGKARVQL